jgi:predicted nucleic acid-binding protein
VELIEAHLAQRAVTMSPVVLAELLSDPLRSLAARESLLQLPLLKLIDGFWERAGLTRAVLVRNGLKPKLADTSIAQLCIDHRIPLHTRDLDFRPFAAHAGLRLVLHGGVN